MVTVALLVRVEAKPGKEAEVEEFLTNAQTIVMGEPDTVAWFAVKFGPSSFGIFDAFPGEAGRDARSAVGAPSLPLGVAVEIEAIFEIN